MFAGSRLLLPVSTNFVTLVPKPGRKEGHAVREPSLLRGIAVLRRSGSRKKRRPVSGAGVVHYQLLHLPRSVPTALGPTPLVTVSFLGKSHADSELSRANCSHGESFSLASLHSRIAFFSESDSAPRALPFSSFQGPVRKKLRGR